MSSLAEAIKNLSCTDFTTRLELVKVALFNRVSALKTREALLLSKINNLQIKLKDCQKAHSTDCNTDRGYYCTSEERIKQRAVLADLEILSIELDNIINTPLP